MKQINPSIKRSFFLGLFMIIANQAMAQNTGLKLGQNPGRKDPSALFEMEASDKEVLLPRVKLTSTTVAAPLILPAEGLTVYNTGTTGDVWPGYYYWDAVNRKWMRLVNGTDVPRYIKASNGLSMGADGSVQLGGNLTGSTYINLMGNSFSLAGLPEGETKSGSMVVVSNSGTLGRLPLNSGGLNAYYWSTSGNTIESGYPRIGTLNDVDFTLIRGGEDKLKLTKAGRAILYSSSYNPNFRSLYINGGNENSPLADANIGIGNYALYAVTTGSYNLAIGQSALAVNTTGKDNIALGYNALGGTGLGNGNVAIGTSAGYNVMPDFVTNNSVMIGYKSNVGGDNGIAIGANTYAPKNGMSIGSLIFGTNLYSIYGIPTGSVGIRTANPTNTLHVSANSDPIRLEGLQASTTAATDKIVSADANGVLKVLKAAMPQFFYMPSILIPANKQQFDAPGSGKLPSDSFDDTSRKGTINLYNRYVDQFNGTLTATKRSSPGAPALPVLPPDQLYYYIGWFDANLFDSVAVDAAGVLTYTVKADTDISTGSFMNIIFSVKQ